MRKETKKTEGYKMKGKKQRRFERRLAERRLLQREGLLKTSRQRRSERRLAERALREQGAVTKATGEQGKKPAAVPSDNRLVGERSKNLNAHTPGFQGPWEAGYHKGKEMNG